MSTSEQDRGDEGGHVCGQQRLHRCGESCRSCSKGACWEQKCQPSKHWQLSRMHAMLDVRHKGLSELSAAVHCYVYVA